MVLISVFTIMMYCITKIYGPVGEYPDSMCKYMWICFKTDSVILIKEYLCINKQNYKTLVLRELHW